MDLCLTYLTRYICNAINQFFPDLLVGENYPQLTAVLCLATMIRDYPYLTLIVYGSIGYYLELSAIMTHLIHIILAVACWKITIRFLTIRSPAKFEVSVPGTSASSPALSADEKQQKMPLTVASRPDKIQCWSPVDGKYLGEVSATPGCMAVL